MKQWALDMDEPSAGVRQTEEDREGAEAAGGILAEAAALDRQATDAHDTAASQQGSQETDDSFQEAGQQPRPR